MLKESSYKEKFAKLANWMPAIINDIKKDIKNEHLKKDLAFVRHYFSTKNINKLSSEELSSAYVHAVANGDDTEELADFISNRWLMKHGDLYHFFEQKLSLINPSFNEIDHIEQKAALSIMQESVKQFGAAKTYLFCILNSVVFPEEVYVLLAQQAENQTKENEIETAQRAEQESVDGMKRNYELQIARLTDKYEKKLQGVQKKYTHDVDALKKQVAHLQRKLNSSK